MAREGFLVELVHPDREVIHDTGRALVVEGDKGLGDPEAHNFVALVLAHH